MLCLLILKQRRGGFALTKPALTLKRWIYDHWFEGSFTVTQFVTVLEPVMYENFYFYFSEMKVHVFYISQKFQIFLKKIDFYESF